MAILAGIGVSAALFVSTNLDDLLVLIALFADPTLRASWIVAGQCAGMAALVAVSLAASLVALVLPGALVGLLGLVPIAIGLKRLADLRRPPAATREGGRGGLLTATVLTLVNGGDNIAVYTPMFAAQTVREASLAVAVFAVMTVLWCWLAHGLVRHPALGGPIRRWGPRILPVVLVVVGAAVLSKVRWPALRGG